MVSFCGNNFWELADLFNTMTSTVHVLPAVHITRHFSIRSMCREVIEFDNALWSPLLVNTQLQNLITNPRIERDKHMIQTVFVLNIIKLFYPQ